MTNPTAPTDGATPSSWLPTWLCGRRKPGRVCCRASGSVDLLSPFTLRVHSQGSLVGSTPRVHFQGSLLWFTPRCAFMRFSGHGWLGMLVALAGVKSVPIGTVFRSKGQKSTNLVRFSGFLVLLSRFVVVVQGIIPARRWIQEKGGHKSAPTSHPSTQTQDFPMGVEPIAGAHPLLTSWLLRGS